MHADHEEGIHLHLHLHISGAVCLDPFTQIQGMASQGGAGQSGVTTLDACKTECRDESECVGFDWTLDTSATIRCWLFTDISAFEVNSVNTGVDQYDRGDCEGWLCVGVILPWGNPSLG